MNSFRFIESDPRFFAEATREMAPLQVGGGRSFWFMKRIFDCLFSIFLIPALLICAVLLTIVNPFLNPGSLLYVQKRMGKGCTSFSAYKFRSMRSVSKLERGADDPLESDRISMAGKFIRKSRIDELPQIINVLLGDMSLLGPRPDYFEHAREYCVSVPNYRSRYSVRPGISGLAQVRLGYVEGTQGTHAKTAVDLEYLRNASFRQDTALVFETIRCVAMRAGA
ncbi:sugar transferase [Falsihalocynthiibacter sp. BN13B15]|uniref:sugar transferase n=1 Tax=Falsihalocynthiibacter sp. BN13B15 TaxID=3240871 RepID=UPI003510CB06